MIWDFGTGIVCRSGIKILLSFYFKRINLPWLFMTCCWFDFHKRWDLSSVSIRSHGAPFCLCIAGLDSDKSARNRIERLYRLSLLIQVAGALLKGPTVAEMGFVLKFSLFRSHTRAARLPLWNTNTNVNINAQLYRVVTSQNAWIRFTRFVFGARGFPARV